MDNDNEEIVEGEEVEETEIETETEPETKAEEVKEVFPDMVGQKKVSHMFGKNSYRDTKINTVDESSLIPVLVASLQLQQQQIEKLTAEVELLKSKKNVVVN